MKEKLAAWSVVLTLIAIPTVIGWYCYIQASAPYLGDVRVFDITGVAEDGAWTLEKVRGFNYWWRRFAPMTLYLDLGDQVVLRLRSADVLHQFYVPGLNLGPVDVKPGGVVEVKFKAVKAGVYQYYCTSLCGGCHFYMSGWIVITPRGEIPVTPKPIVCPLCFPGFDKPPEGEFVRLGEYFYLKLGCNTCHGIEGRGGVENFNYINKTIPAHNTTAEKMFLEEPEDAEAFVELIKKHPNLNKLKVISNMPRSPLVLSRFKSAKEIINKGKRCARLDAKGPEPPLQMPAWQAVLPERDIDAIIIYFISLYPWEEI